MVETAATSTDHRFTPLKYMGSPPPGSEQRPNTKSELRGNGIKFLSECCQMSLTPALAPARVPDRSRRVGVQPFTPNDLCVAEAINDHFTIIAAWKSNDLRFSGSSPRTVAGSLVLAAPVRDT